MLYNVTVSVGDKKYQLSEVESTSQTPADEAQRLRSLEYILAPKTKTEGFPGDPLHKRLEGVVLIPRTHVTAIEVQPV